MRSQLFAALVCALWVGVSPAMAGERDSGVVSGEAGDASVRLEGEAAKKIHARLMAVRPDLPVAAVEPAPVSGLYAVEFIDGTFFYATDDGQFLVAGDLYQITDERIVNRTEDQRGRQRAQQLSTLDHGEMIIFEANGERRAVVHVFTDVDCGFCRRLHLEVPELNRRGVEIRYLAYPRAGIGSQSYERHVAAWCANDRNTAITRLKEGEPVEPRTCPNPVADHFQFGQTMGVRGTPAIFLEDGRYLPGYMPADQLVQELGLE